MFYDKNGDPLPLYNKSGVEIDLFGKTDPEPPAPSMVDPATPDGVQPVGTSGDLELVLSEEFTGAVHITNPVTGHVKFRDTGFEWATWYPNWSRFTSQDPGGNHTNTNQDAYYATSKVSVSGGALHLACDEQETVAGLPYTAGMITSKDLLEQEYGWFEARIKITGTRNSRHWPAWWMATAETNAWPPEVDTWELFGTADEYLTNVYYPSGGLEPDIHANTFSDFSSYHTYGVHWTSGEITFYRDGVETYSTTDSVSGPQYLILNNGAEHVATGTMPVVDVDYVRAWSIT